MAVEQGHGAEPEPPPPPQRRRATPPAAAALSTPPFPSPPPRSARLPAASHAAVAQHSVAAGAMLPPRSMGAVSGSTPPRQSMHKPRPELPVWTPPTAGLATSAADDRSCCGRAARRCFAALVCPLVALCHLVIAAGSLLGACAVEGCRCLDRLPESIAWCVRDAPAATLAAVSVRGKPDPQRHVDHVRIHGVDHESLADAGPIDDAADAAAAGINAATHAAAHHAARGARRAVCTISRASARSAGSALGVCSAT